MALITPVSTPLPPLAREPRHAPGTEVPPPVPAKRNPQREWAAPPPWADEQADGSGAGSAYGPAAAGLAGSAAYRMAGPDPAQPATPRPTGYAPVVDDLDDAWPDVPDDDIDDADPAGVDDDGYNAGSDTPSAAARAAGVAGGTAAASGASSRGGASATSGSGATPGSRDQVHRAPVQDPSEVFGPAWEKPRRYEAYPSLKTRVGLPSMGGIPRIAVALIVLVLAALALFFVGPSLLGIGGKDSGAGPGPRVTAAPTAATAATPSSEITPVPAPTPHVYVVVKGDVMSVIARKFGVTVAQLKAANPKIKNLDKIKPGDKINIPAPVPAAGQVSAAPSP